MSIKVVATSKNVLQVLKQAGNSGLTMLQTAIKITHQFNAPCLPSDITSVFSTLEKEGLIKREGRRKNPLLAGKRVSKTANIFTIK